MRGGCGRVRLLYRFDSYVLTSLKLFIMTREEIKSNNKLIAEFMGWKVLPFKEKRFKGWYYGISPDSTRYNGLSIEGEEKCWLLVGERNRYHSSWNSLMPVVEKIESLGYWFNIKKNHVTVAYDNKGTFDSTMIHSEFGDQPKITRVFECVIAFIKWYNLQK